MGDLDVDTKHHVEMIEEELRVCFADLLGVRAVCRSHVLNRNYFRWWSKILWNTEAACLIIQQLEELDGIVNPIEVFKLKVGNCFFYSSS